eukprot:9049361-Pyramimonas_sp.AAC.1
MDAVEVPPWDREVGAPRRMICSDDILGFAEALVPCGHLHHAECLRQWRISQPSQALSNGRCFPVNCPICRSVDR